MGDRPTRSSHMTLKMKKILNSWARWQTAYSNEPWYSTLRPSAIQYGSPERIRVEHATLTHRVGLLRQLGTCIGPHGMGGLATHRQWRKHDTNDDRAGGLLALFERGSRASNAKNRCGLGRGQRHSPREYALPQCDELSVAGATFANGTPIPKTCYARSCWWVRVWCRAIEARKSGHHYINARDHLGFSQIKARRLEHWICPKQSARSRTS